MGQLTLPSSGSIYLDASVIIYSVEKIEPYWSLLLPLWHVAKSESVTLHGSELLLLETLVKPVQKGDQVVEAAFRELLTSSKEVLLTPITLDILEKAVQLRATTNLKTPDAIHAATALQLGCRLIVTNDSVFRQVSGFEVLLLKDFI